MVAPGILPITPLMSTPVSAETPDGVTKAFSHLSHNPHTTFKIEADLS